MLLNFRNEKLIVPADAIKGDFNGDGKTEYAWINKPKVNADNTDCIGPCVVHIAFSDAAIKPIELKGSIGGTLSNLGDLNGDGKDDIGILPDWFNGCWRNYFTYTLKGGDWHYLVEPFATHCNQWEDNIKPLEKISGKPGYLKENYSVFENNDIAQKSKVVKIN